MATKIVSIINLKGGVGKSTLAMILAEFLVFRYSKKVLLIDMDAQGNLSYCMVPAAQIETQERNGRLLDRFDLKASMSGRGNCFDNAPMESFWGTLKQELIHHRHYTRRPEAMREITEHIEIFCNRQRRQARLGFLSPAAYAQRFYAAQPAA